MKCERCGHWTEVAETRKADDGYTLRRVRLCANGHRFTTYEVLGPIYRKDRPTIQQTIGHATKRAAQWARDRKIVNLLQSMSASQVAPLVGLKKAAINKIRRTFK